MNPGMSRESRTTSRNPSMRTRYSGGYRWAGRSHARSSRTPAPFPTTLRPRAHKMARLTISPPTARPCSGVNSSPSNARRLRHLRRRGGRLVGHDRPIPRPCCAPGRRRLAPRALARDSSAVRPSCCCCCFRIPFARAEGAPSSPGRRMLRMTTGDMPRALATPSLRVAAGWRLSTLRARATPCEPRAHAGAHSAAARKRKAVPAEAWPGAAAADVAALPDLDERRAVDVHVHVHVHVHA